jgi:hypothetical protein
MTFRKIFTLLCLPACVPIYMPTFGAYLPVCHCAYMPMYKHAYTCVPPTSNLTVLNTKPSTPPFIQYSAFWVNHFPKLLKVHSETLLFTDKCVFDKIIGYNIFIYISQALSIPLASPPFRLEPQKSQW